jgi:hypothetical protein
MLNFESGFLSKNQNYLPRRREEREERLKQKLLLVLIGEEELNLWFPFAFFAPSRFQDVGLFIGLRRSPAKESNRSII